MNASPTISNPKRGKSTASQKDAWFDYYAGFSGRFVSDVLQAVHLKAGSLILDPWNGAGTTTVTARDQGFRSIGVDVNPVMVIVARAKLLTRGVQDSLLPLAEEILAKSANGMKSSAREPLLAWLAPQSALTIRSIANAITSMMTSEPDSLNLHIEESLRGVSELASFFLVALFKTLRGILQPFQTTNPTWMKIPASLRRRLKPSISNIRSSFQSIVTAMASAVSPCQDTADSVICLGNSSSLPNSIDNVDAVISSPPYCTRIDYAVATSPELAILGFSLDSEFRNLRQSFIGSPVVNKTQPLSDRSWGSTCNQLLNKVHNHPSKGSRSYYYKTFAQYFGGMHSSLVQINKVIAPGGPCILVVQDSRYKSEHIDVARILTEMTSHMGWNMRHRFDFETSSIMARLNPRSRKYYNHRTATESVLWFETNKE